MAAQRSISVRKVLRFLLTVASVVGLVVAVSSAARRQEKQHLQALDVRITNSDAVGFVGEKDLKELLFTRRHIQPTALALGDMDVRRMESIAVSNPWIESAQVYIDHQRVLHVQATQRVPFVRIFENSGDSYYLDTALKQLPLSSDYVHYAPVVTGVPHMLDSSAKKAIQAQIVYVVDKLSADPFWKQGVEEIVVRPDGEFELIPVLGNHRALLGDTSALDTKLRTLFLFYRNVLNRIGWDRYTLLDARYNGQVVASPALPWKPPVDRALSNMNWVKTIVKEDIPDTLTPILKAREAARQPVLPPAAKPAQKTAATASAKTPSVKPKTAATSQPPKSNSAPARKPANAPKQAAKPR